MDKIKLDNMQKGKRGFWSSFWAYFIFIVWIFYLVLVYVIWENNRDAEVYDVLMVGFILAIVLVGLSGAAGMAVLFNKKIKDTSFVLHGYDVYDWEECEYERFYLVETVSVYEKFIFNWSTGHYLTRWTAADVDKRIGENQDTFGYHRTKEEAMGNIINKVKKIMSDEKEAAKTDVRDITMAEDAFTVEEIKKMIKNEDVKRE